MTKFGNAVVKSLGMDQARDRDPDIEQAWLRIGISLLASLYVLYLVRSSGAFTPGLVLGAVAANGAMLIGALMILRLRRDPRRRAALRYLGIFTDIAAVTIGMAGADEGGVPMIGVYLWVTVGNGFRFGPRFLLAAYWLSLVGFTLLLLYVPFWITHRAIGIGLLIAITVVPIYVLVLLSRLTAQKDAAEQLSNAKSRFVANVSHELRTPLAGVFSVHELLRMRDLPTDERELVGMLGNSITTLKASVDAILQMSKLEAGSETAEHRLFNLWFFLRQVESLVRPQGSAKNLAWQLDLDPSTPAAVIGDPNHLSHVLGNLLNNAFKFTQRGSVSLRVYPVGLARVRFEVVDTGIGIPADQQEHLFERFVQVDNSATRRYSGTGLGTSIARDLVELMGGNIGVVSAPGKGTTFWVEIPFEIPNPMSARQDWGGRREVLVVGDASPEMADVVSGLRAIGIEPIVTSATATAIRYQLSRDAATRLATLFVMAPAQAVGVWAEIADERGLAHCPWLGVSRKHEASEAAMLAQRGSSGYLCTPVDHEALSLTLASLICRLDLGDSYQPATVARQKTTPLRVLLADDNLSNQMLLSRILAGAGHDVVCAASGGQAFDIMANDRIDVAILDLNMPDMSGPDVVKLFRASSIGAARLPIMILSADATPAAKQESIEAGADEFLTKPVIAGTLFSALERLKAGAPRDDGAAETKAANATNHTDTPTQPASTPAVVVDSERIQALRRIARGDERFLEKYISAAFSEMEQAISDLRKAMSETNATDARNALHILEGTGATIGAVALVENCKSMRGYLGLEQDAESAHALAELSANYTLAKSVILAHLHNANVKAPRSNAPQ
jgi:two-component system, sensor histidine kinase RpfC